MIYIYIYIYIGYIDCFHDICVIMKTMCSPGYHCNGFVATHALWAHDAPGHMMYNICIYISVQHFFGENPFGTFA